MYSADCWNQPFSGDGILRNRCWRLLCHSLESREDANSVVRAQSYVMWYVLCVTKSTGAPTVFVRVWFEELAQNHCQINTKDMRNYLSVSLKSWMIILFSHIFPIKPVVISTCFLELSKSGGAPWLCQWSRWYLAASPGTKPEGICTAKSPAFESNGTFWRFLYKKSS